MIKITLVILTIASIISLIIWSFSRQRKKLAAYKLPEATPHLLYNYVPFYRRLNAADRQKFEERMRDFLARTKITGVGGVTIYAIDMVFIAACAIIPLFGYPDSRYNNLDEVLVYNDTFNMDYDTDGPGRNILGMVGDGHLQRQMLLSQPALRAGFLYPDNMHNTAIHEFVHLIDKADGMVDGVPRYMLDKEMTQPWKEHMQAYIGAIRQGYTDINPYGATNEGEFLAVISEYYFKQPEILKSQYPGLYDLLAKMYKQDIATIIA